MELLVVTAGDPAVDVAFAGHPVGFDHLWRRGQEVAHGIELALGDLEADEGKDIEAHLLEVDVEAGSSKDPGRLETVEAGLDGGTGGGEAAGKLQDWHSGLCVELGKDPGIERVEADGHRGAGSNSVGIPSSSPATCRHPGGSGGTRRWCRRQRWPSQQGVVDRQIVRTIPRCISTSIAKCTFY